MKQKDNHNFKVSSTKNLLAKLRMSVSTEQLRALHQKAEGHPLILRIIAELYDRGLPLDRLLTISFRNSSRESKGLSDPLFSELWEVMSIEEAEYAMSQAIKIREKMQHPALENDLALLAQIRYYLKKKSERMKIILNRFRNKFNLS